MPGCDYSTLAIVEKLLHDLEQQYDLTIEVIRYPTDPIDAISGISVKSKKRHSYGYNAFNIYCYKPHELDIGHRAAYFQKTTWYKIDLANPQAFDTLLNILKDEQVSSHID